MAPAPRALCFPGQEYTPTLPAPHSPVQTRSGRPRPFRVDGGPEGSGRADLIALAFHELETRGHGSYLSETPREGPRAKFFAPLDLDPVGPCLWPDWHCLPKDPPVWSPGPPESATAGLLERGRRQCPSSVEQGPGCLDTQATRYSGVRRMKGSLAPEHDSPESVRPRRRSQGGWGSTSGRSANCGALPSSTDAPAL